MRGPADPIKKRVLIVDDTRTIRAMIRARLENSDRLEIVGEAQDPIEARDLIERLSPDVLTLDVVMPKMDGLEFLKELMQTRPLPVVMVSSRTSQNSRAAIRALSLGAIDCVDLGRLRNDRGQCDLVNIVLTAASSNVRRYVAPAPQKPAAVPSRAFKWNGKTVLIGSSTGGVDALLQVIGAYPPDCPPTLIAQHMPASFLKSFCKRLDTNCAPRVCLARAGMEMEQGTVYLAAGGDEHVTVSKRSARRIDIMPHDGQELYVPSVNLLFGSAEVHGRSVLGVMLTGMGSDGAEAMLRMRQAGAHTVVQDSESCVVDGMPKSARKIGAATEVAPLSEIGNRILNATSRSKQELPA